MGAIVKFMGDFLNQFVVKGFWGILKGIGLGIANIFNIPKYITIFKSYSSELGAGGIVLAILAIILVLAVLAGIIFLIVLLCKKYIRFRKTGQSERPSAPKNKFILTQVRVSDNRGNHSVDFIPGGLLKCQIPAPDQII